MSVPERVPENLALQRLSSTAFAVRIYCTKHPFPSFFGMRTGSALLQVKFRLRDNYPNDLAFSPASTLIC